MYLYRKSGKPSLDKTFQDEYRKFLEEYEVEYDERYVWD